MQGLIGPIFVKKNVDGSVYQKILKKEAFLQFSAMKKLLNTCHGNEKKSDTRKTLILVCHWTQY